jgi:predicted kinase
LSEIAFVTMDLEERGRTDYAYRLLDRYLQATGDYRGLPLLTFYQVYRALVRAKVAALRAGQQQEPVLRSAALADCARYLAHALRLIVPRPPMLLLMHGVSGSGKSRLAQRLLQDFGALRLRSDVERKRLPGLPALTGSAAGVGEGFYTEEVTRATYGRLVELARALLHAGYPVFVDAANLRRWQRDAFRELARELKLPFAIVACSAPEALLHERISRRRAAGDDASDADLAVLAQQLRTLDPLTAEEEACCLRVDTGGEFEFSAELSQRLRDLLAPGLVDAG